MLKNDLGYNSRGRLFFGGSNTIFDSPNKNNIITTERIESRSTIHQPKINIETFLRILNSKGICTFLIPYNIFGGSKTYKIQYSLN